jgi:hypothetical protein
MRFEVSIVAFWHLIGIRSPKAGDTLKGLRNILKECDTVGRQL